MDKKYKILIAIILTVSILLLIGFVVWLCFFRRNNNVLQSIQTYYEKIWLKNGTKIKYLKFKLADK